MGLIILAALFVFDPIVGLGCMLGGLTATVVELVLGLHPWGDLTNGVACFNGVLVGTVIPILYPAAYNTDRTLAMWLAVAGGSIVRSELRSSKQELYRSLPFITHQPPTLTLFSCSDNLLYLSLLQSDLSFAILIHLVIVGLSVL